MWGTQAEYAALRPHEAANDPQHKVFMVLGPWNHGGWGRHTADSLASDFGKLSYGADINTTYRRDFEASFFEFYLKGKPGFNLADTASFRTGENSWHRYDVWPPKTGFHAVRAYLTPDKALTFAPPTGDYDV